VARARIGRATPEELTAGTFTLNNYGGLRVDGSAAIINHPQVAILGFGRIIDRPWVVDGQIVPRKITQMSFVFDHRVCDGGTAAAFMRSVADAASVVDGCAMTRSIAAGARARLPPARVSAGVPGTLCRRIKSYPRISASTCVAYKRS
jgi:hypothetical protein